mgnify:CR=1 FL=1
MNSNNSINNNSNSNKSDNNNSSNNNNSINNKPLWILDSRLPKIYESSHSIFSASMSVID